MGRLCCFVLQIVVGSLFLIRKPLRRDGSLVAIALSLPSLVIGGVAFRSTVPLEKWPPSADVLFLVGSIVSLAAFISLGRSFAILPALRTIVVQGPYRVVRHPAYLGELLLVLACCQANTTWTSPLLFVLATAAVVLRIRAEEGVLLQTERYRAYCVVVKARLVPWVW